MKKITLFFSFCLLLLSCDSITKTAQIHNAASSGDIKKVEAILKNSPSKINIQNALGNTPLYLASIKGHKEIVIFLIKKGADIELGNTKNERPIAKACKFSHKDVVKILIDAGANINSWDIWGKTPLHEAARSGDLEVVKLLISNGANVLVKDLHDHLPRDIAHRHRQLVSYLKKKELEAQNEGRKVLQPVREDPAMKGFPNYPKQLKDKTKKANK